jgi:hypothetical protein
MAEIVNIELTNTVKPKKVQSEAVKKAKAKYYQKKKEDAEFMEKIKDKSKTYYHENKDKPEFKEYHKKYYEENKEEIMARNQDYYKNYYYNKKFQEVKTKLEEIGFDQLAKILIATHKTKILNTELEIS